MLSIQYYTWISELGDPSIVICIVTVNAISVIQRRIDRSTYRRFSIKSYSYKFLKIHWKTPVPESLLKRLYYRFIPVSFPKFVGPLYLQNTVGRVLLHLEPCQISMIELFCGNSKSLTVFEKKPSYMFIKISQISLKNCCVGISF